MSEQDAARDQERADHKAKQLHNLGWEMGTGAGVWARVVSDELERHEAARENFAASADRAAWDRLHGTAYLLVLAIQQILAFESRVRRLTGDAEFARARAQFDAAGPRAESLRDIVVHLDDYATGEGLRQRGAGAGPQIREPYLETHIYWTDAGQSILELGGESLKLRTAAKAAIRLAETVERIRGKYLERAEREANTALRRRYGPII
jgi:hypothetical protein